MDVAQAEAFEWLRIDHISGYQRQFGHIDVKVMFAGQQPASLAAIFDEIGNELPEARLLQGITQLVPPAEDPEIEVERQIPVRMKVLAPGWTATDPEGVVWPIDHLQVQTSFTTTKTVVPLVSHRYTGNDRSYSVATAKTPINGLKGSIVMLQEDAKDRTAIYWVPDGDE